MKKYIILIIVLVISLFAGILALYLHIGEDIHQETDQSVDSFEDVYSFEYVEEPLMYLSWDELTWTGPDTNDEYVMDVAIELLSDYDDENVLDRWSFGSNTLSLFYPGYALSISHKKNLRSDIPKRRFFNNIISYTGRKNDLLLSMYSRFREIIFTVLTPQRFYDLQIQDLIRMLNESYAYYYRNGYLNTEKLQNTYEGLSDRDNNTWLYHDAEQMAYDCGVIVYDDDETYSSDFYERFWAYSFWARRHAENNIPAVKAILDDLWAYYVEGVEFALEKNVLNNAPRLTNENGDYIYDNYDHDKLTLVYYYDIHGQRTGNWVQYSYYGDEKLCECQMQNDMLHGEYKEYSGGKLKRCYQFVDDVLISGVFYDDEGTIKESVRYEFIDGQLKEFIDRGDEGTIERQQINDKTDGLYIVKYPDGGLKIEANYSQRKRNGEYKKYYQSGQIEEHSNYTDGVIDGTRLLYYEDGKPKVEANYVKNYRNGDYKEYYPSGEIKLHYVYKMEKPEGINRYYYKNGKIRTESRWSAGKTYADEIKEYHSTGRLVSVSTSVNVNGNIGFLCKIFDENGNLQGELTKVNDKKHGVCKIYFPSGILKEEAVYNNDQPEGIHKTFYENGTPEWVLPYERGERHGECVLYYPSGTIGKSLHMVYGKKTGIETVFYEDGKTESEVTWVDDKREGVFRHYYPSGAFKDEGYFRNDKLDGEFITYKKNGKINKKMNYKDGNLL
ncbi:MAG: toxin-antitoxin system YwqK family antitoxin [Tannerellaceae bacterium]|nr:toxin-antitoxin system YwqK family antitoxin [Tannerellaceae bacterium]